MVICRISEHRDAPDTGSIMVSTTAARSTLAIDEHSGMAAVSTRENGSQVRRWSVPPKKLQDFIHRRRYGEIAFGRGSLLRQSLSVLVMTEQDPEPVHCKTAFTRRNQTLI